MTDVARNCSTCVYWRPATAAWMNQPAGEESSQALGVCECFPPQVFIVSNAPMIVQPRTHASRCCGEWTPTWPGDDDPDGDGEPVPKPEPDLNKVRRLFPNPPKPIAA